MPPEAGFGQKKRGHVIFSQGARVGRALALDALSHSIHDHIGFLRSNVAGDDPLQQYLRSYMGLGETGGAEYPPEAIRYALNVELVLQSLPQGGTWVDCGSFGHDALRVQAVNPKIIPRLFSFEGGRVAIGATGFRYVIEASGSERFLHIGALDFEREPIPLDTGSADLVTTFETIEHFRYGPQKLFLELNRVCRKNARLIVTVPNAVSAASLWRLLHKEHPALCSTYHRDMSYGRTHPSEYAPRQLHDLALAYGFRIEALSAFQCGDYQFHEREAIRWAHKGNFRGSLQGDDDFGTTLLLIARKDEDVMDVKYPASLFAS